MSAAHWAHLTAIERHAVVKQQHRPTKRCIYRRDFLLLQSQPGAFILQSCRHVAAACGWVGGRGHSRRPPRRRYGRRRSKCRPRGGVLCGSTANLENAGASLAAQPLCVRTLLVDFATQAPDHHAEELIVELLHALDVLGLVCLVLQALPTRQGEC